MRPFIRDYNIMWGGEGAGDLDLDNVKDSLHRLRSIHALCFSSALLKLYIRRYVYWASIVENFWVQIGL